MIHDHSMDQVVDRVCRHWEARRRAEAARKEQPHQAPLAFTITTLQGQTIQKLSIDKETGVVSFLTGDAPLLGLGEGGPQFDRRGSTDRMRSGQGGYQLATHGGRVPIPWLIGTGGWAMFFHQPFGTFDFTGQESKFLPTNPENSLPLDIFVVSSRDPATINAWPCVFL